tara:strand:+ start:583 stop:1749 length:1167 start_codon:yes stop_codon:yes gene_type:complete
MLKFNRNYKNKIEKYFLSFKNLSSKGNFNFKSFDKLISNEFLIPVFSERYNYSTRYIEQATALPSRWSKSLLRDSFSKTDGKFVKIVTLKTKESFFLNAYDYVLCLADKERISVEISYGNNEIYNLNSIKKILSKKKIKQINNGIVFLHTSTYNIWHHYVEMICIVYHYLIKFKNTKKKIYIPYNKDSLKILKLLGIENKVELYDNKRVYYSKNCEFLNGIFDEVLPFKSLDLCKKKILKKISNFKTDSYAKNVFISRGDDELNRRNLVNEKKVINLISKKYQDLKIFKPGKNDIYNNISNIFNSKNIFSLMGTQLYFNSLFSKRPKKIFEIVGENYRGFTVGELVAKYLKCEYVRLESNNCSPGYAIYSDQIANLSKLKKIIIDEKK